MSTMAALDLERFAKIRTLHDRTNLPGEKAAAAMKMETLARNAGMSVEQAVSTLDRRSKAPPKPQPKTQAQATAEAFNDFFNSPEMLAERAEREAKRRVKAAGIIAEFGSEEAVFADTPMEAALRQECEPLLGPGETWNTIYRLDGWDGYGAEKMPASVRKAVTEAWPLPKSVAGAWAEYEASEKLLSARYVVEYHYTPHSFMDARRYVVEDLCNTLPARSLNDLRARLSWMEFWADSEAEQEPNDHRINLATLRADIERMGERIRELPVEPVQNVQSDIADGLKSQPVSSVQTGHVVHHSTAEKRAAVIELLHSSEGARLSDRKIARRAGVSPQTVGNIRRSLGS